jgi:hypothetical protein
LNVALCNSAVVDDNYPANGIGSIKKLSNNFAYLFKWPLVCVVCPKPSTTADFHNFWSLFATPGKLAILCCGNIGSILSLITEPVNSKRLYHKVTSRVGPWSNCQTVSVHSFYAVSCLYKFHNPSTSC